MNVSTKGHEKWSIVTNRMFSLPLKYSSEIFLVFPIIPIWNNEDFLLQKNKSAATMLKLLVSMQET